MFYSHILLKITRIYSQQLLPYLYNNGHTTRNFLREGVISIITKTRHAGTRYDRVADRLPTCWFRSLPDVSTRMVTIQVFSDSVCFVPPFSGWTKTLLTHKFTRVRHNDCATPYKCLQQTKKPYNKKITKTN